MKGIVKYCCLKKITIKHLTKFKLNDYRAWWDFLVVLELKTSNITSNIINNSRMKYRNARQDITNITIS